MGNVNFTVRKIADLINNEEQYGGLWLPNIQRYFIWEEDQIERIFDSIMRKYPIGTFLFWKTREPIKSRKFIDEYKDGLKITNFYKQKNKKIKTLVLDGQQRLQSFFIALKGSYNGKELYFDVLSDENNENNGIKFKFKFIKTPKIKNLDSWIKVKDIIYNMEDSYELAEKVSAKVIANREKNQITSSEKALIHSNISKMMDTFTSKDVVIGQELDSVDNPELYNLDDVVEVFIRANSGGTELSKSDLMFSLLTSKWEDIEEDLTDFIDEIDDNKYEFSRDFVLKTSLILIGTGAKYDVKKFRKEKNLDKMQNEWQDIKNSIKIIRDFLSSSTYIRDDKALPSYLGLIPLIYYKYKYPNKWNDKDKKKLSGWLIRILLAGSFSGSSDTILNAVVKDIIENNDFIINSINNVILNRGRSLKVTKESLLDINKGSKYLYLIFALLYKDFDFKPTYEGNLPAVDHIFPKSKLKEIKVINPDTNRKIMKYRKPDRNQIGNLMLLSKEENRDDKRAKLPKEWFKDKEDEYLDLHLIPRNPELWKLKNYESFIDARNKMLADKFYSMGLLQKESNTP